VVESVSLHHARAVCTVPEASGIPHTQWTLLQLKNHLVYCLSHSCEMRTYGFLSSFSFAGAWTLEIGLSGVEIGLSDDEGLTTDWFVLCSSVIDLVIGVGRDGLLSECGPIYASDFSLETRKM
jgi:hypothetical protein